MKNRIINGELVSEFEDNENVDIGCYKIIEREFINSNYINLSCIFKYAYSKDDYIGRGDKKEGLIARLHIEKHKKILERYRRTFKGDLIEKNVGKYVEIKRHSSFFVPIYCFYAKAKKSSDYTADRYPSIIETKYSLDTDLFKGFGDDIDKLSLIIFNSQNSLKEAIKEAIDIHFPKEVKKINIEYASVKYVIPEEGYWECEKYMDGSIPDNRYELFCKREKYKDQNEARIAVITDFNTLSLNKLNYLLEISSNVFNERLKEVPISGIGIEIKNKVINGNQLS